MSWRPLHVLLMNNHNVRCPDWVGRERRDAPHALALLVNKHNVDPRIESGVNNTALSTRPRHL